MLHCSHEYKESSEEFTHVQPRVSISIAQEKVGGQSSTKQVTSDTARQVFGRNMQQEPVCARRIRRYVYYLLLSMARLEHIHGVERLCHVVDLLKHGICRTK